ncbi:unnamed protein product [Leptidea sinapis]|uniref:Uncharacterized protein n=1 Tax=Leptidea sinapis TaxID=189913 RepID=A0A5E4QSZ5_9NEOP|nr:unnamed protein product [Leptidea sinapis]
MVSRIVDPVFILTQMIFFYGREGQTSKHLTPGELSVYHRSHSLATLEESQERCCLLRNVYAFFDGNHVVYSRKLHKEVH